MKFNFFKIITIVLLTAVCFNMSFADDSKIECDGIERRIGDFRQEHNTAICKHEMCVLYNKYDKELKVSHLPNKNFYIQVRQYLKKLPYTNQFIQEDIQKLDNNISYVIRMLNQYEIDLDINKTKQLFKSNRFDPHKIDYNKLTKAQTCNEKNSNNVYEYIKNIFITKVILADYSRKYVGALDDLPEELRKINKEWDIYRKSSINLYPWELLTLNEWFYKPSSDGFNEPPNYQYLFLHPTMAFSYQDHRENKLNDTLLIDIVGFYDWQGKHMNKPYGLSLAGAYDGKDWGYGVNARVWNENISFAVMQNHKNKTYFVFSIELSNFIMDKKSQVKNFRRQLNNKLLN